MRADSHAGDSLPPSSPTSSLGCGWAEHPTAQGLPRAPAPSRRRLPAAPRRAAPRAQKSRKRYLTDGTSTSSPSSSLQQISKVSQFELLGNGCLEMEAASSDMVIL